VCFLDFFVVGNLLRIGQMQYSFAPPRTNAVQFWVSGTTTIELTYRTDLPFGR
jgi:hypothetical protein